MIQFSEERILQLRKRVLQNTKALEMLKSKCDFFFKYGVKVPPKTLSTWIMDFICPVDSSKLIYDYSNSESFTCPVCGRKYSGNPYLGSWWRYTVENVVNGGYCAALVWMLTEDASYLEMAKKVVCDFARYYPNYELHGNILYNNPGRINSQTLCEALTIRELARTYDIIRDEMTAEECERAEKDLFAPSAQVLMDQRMHQIHNHEVVINTGLAIVGRVLNREDMIRFAVEDKYGLRYQLEHGVLDDGLWFEGTVHYHYFTLWACMLFEKMFMGTKYSLLEEPYYKKMLHMPLQLMQSDYHMPCLGDVNGEGMFEELAEHYEFPYSVYPEEEYARLLNTVYSVIPRDGVEALLYGVDHIPEVGKIELKDYHDKESSGLTVLRGDEGRYLLFKHGRYGGEHDHYDRLGIHFLMNGHDVVDDLGTVGYGAAHHYQYFKNTFTHNTVCMNTHNQPPADGTTTRYEKYADGTTLVEGHVDWLGKGPELDSLTVCQWDEKAYEGVSMDRVILFANTYFVEAFRVRGGKNRTVDWIVHPQGKAKLYPAQYHTLNMGDGAPIQFMHDVRAFESPECGHTQWRTPYSLFTLYSHCDHPSTAIYADGPNNPANETLTYFINRVTDQDDILFVNVFEAQKDISHIQDVSFETNGGSVQVWLKVDGNEHHHQFTVGEEKR